MPVYSDLMSEAEAEINLELFRRNDEIKRFND